MKTNDFRATMAEYCSAVEEFLQKQFTADVPQKTIYEAMRYSLLAGGKRIRPVLVLEFCRLCGGDWQKALPYAAALEMVHTYSLIHDDLPCMDNDDYRRGRLTNHKVYGEAMAVLAGDGLLTVAFRMIAQADLSAASRIRAVEILSTCAGEDGMVGGQVLDLEGEGKHLDAAGSSSIHKLKTGCLIAAACRLGVAATEGTQQQDAAASEYAYALGSAFQIRDDLLDVLGDMEKLGKATHMDENKSTYVSLYGIETCEKMVENETKRAISALSVFEDADFLTSLANQMANRDH